MSLAPFQLSFNGLTMGDGTDYDLVGITGLADLPAVIQTDIPKERAHGQFLGGLFASGREIVLTIEITAAAGTDTAFFANLDALDLATALQPFAELPLAYNLPGMPQAARQVGMRVIGRAVPLDVNYTHRVATAALRLWATDPRIYDALLQTLTTTLPLSNGGLTWPAVWPVAWGSAGGSGSLTVTNAGAFATSPVVVITGPVDNPTIENATEGKHLTFGITLGASDTLTVDFLAQTVILNGTASRRFTMTTDSLWWDLQPGANTFNYRANTVQVGSTASISWRSAWL
jgi:hypothetical protein